MNSMRLLLLVGVVGGSLSTASYAQSTDTVSATSSITIARAIAVANDRNLSFGRCVSPAAAGTVNVAADVGSARLTTGVTCLTQQAADSAVSGQFTVTGEGAAAITVSFDSTVSMTGDGTAIPVTLSSSALPTALSNAAGAEGSATLYIGGTAGLGAAQAAGVYSGTFNVTATYN